MDAAVRLDHMLVAMESANAVHAMLELSFLEAPVADERAPLHVALVLDRSGSMAGEKLEATKACAAHLVCRLRPDDELAVVAFDDQVTLVAPLAGVDPDRLSAAIDGIWAGGSTNLSGGWLKGLEELGRATGDGPRAVVLLTDGQANVGVVEPARLVAMTSGARGTGAFTSTIGFGDGFDEDLLSDMADAGGGNAHFAAGPEDAPAIFAEEFDGLASTVAQNVSVEVGPGPDVEVLAVLNDHPATPVPGGLQLALGDAWGGDHRRIVLRLGIPAVAELGPRKVADVCIRWTDVTGVPALHERTLPVLVNVGPVEQGPALPVPQDHPPPQAVSAAERDSGSTPTGPWLRRGATPPTARWSSASSGCRTLRRCGAGVSARAGELAFQRGEGVDHGRCFEGAVAATNAHLEDDAGREETVHRIVRRLEAAADDIGRTRHRHHRRTWQRPEQQRGCGSRAYGAHRRSPVLLDAQDLLLERNGVVDGSSTGCSEQPDPVVGAVVRRWTIGTAPVARAGEALDVGP